MEVLERNYKKILYAVILILIVHIFYQITFHFSWIDETIYGYQSWLTAEGLAEPFTDFRVKYPPIGFYYQVAIQYVFGPSLIAGRFISTILFGFVLALLFKILERHTDKWVALLSLIAITFHPFIVGTFVSNLPYSLTVFFALNALWLISKNKEITLKIAILSSLLMASTVLVRYNMLPVIFIFWGYIYWQTKNISLLLKTIGATLLYTLIIMSPFLLIDSRAAILSYGFILGPLAALIPGNPFKYDVYVDKGIDIFYFLQEIRLRVLLIYFSHYFSLITIFSIGIFVAIKKYTGTFLDFIKKYHFLTLNIVLVIILLISHVFLGPIVSVFYSLYFAFFLLIAALISIYLFLKNRDSGQKEIVIVSIAILFMFQLASIWAIDHNSFPTIFPRIDRTDLARISMGAGFVEELTTPDDLVIELNDGYHAFIAGRRTIPALINGHFTSRVNSNSKLLDEYSLYNIEMLLDWMENDADVLIVQEDTFVLTAHEVAPHMPEYALAEMNRIVEEKYYLVKSISDVYTSMKSYGSNTLSLYRRKPTDF